MDVDEGTTTTCGAMNANEVEVCVLLLGLLK
jgi:hypothetical protein